MNNLIHYEPSDRSDDLQPEQEGLNFFAGVAAVLFVLLVGCVGAGLVWLFVRLVLWLGGAK